MQYYSLSTFGLAYYFQHSGTFNYNGCNTPTDSYQNCTRNMSSSPGVSLANTYCGDYASGTTAYAEGDWLVTIAGWANTQTLTASCDVNGNIQDGSINAV
jgi:hypothetical protein